jgi:hypothetical protein
MYALPPDLSVAEIQSTAIDVTERTKRIKRYAGLWYPELYHSNLHCRESIVVVDLKHGPAVIIT